MLKKTCATGVLALAAAAGALLTSSPASAQVPTWGGGGWGGGWGGGCCGNTSFNSNRIFNHTSVNVSNRNNNVAIATNNNRGRDDGFFRGDGLFDGGFGFDDD